MTDPPDVESILDDLGIEIVQTSPSGWAQVSCPFHEDFHPSFAVHLSHGAFVDRHGAGPDDKGSLLTLVCRILGYTSKEARAWLADRPAPDPSRRPRRRVAQARLDYAQNLHDLSVQFAALPSDRMAQYWFDRGFTGETMGRFEVKYDEADFSLIWPMASVRHGLLGYCRRFVPPFDQPRKYLYDPPGIVLSLGCIDKLEGDGSSVILTEGPLDAFWLHQYGHRNALAMLGSSLTARQLEHLEIVVRPRGTIYLIPDHDQVGMDTSEAIGRMLVLKGYQVRVVQYPVEYGDIQEVPGSMLTDLIHDACPYIEKAGEDA